MEYKKGLILILILVNIVLSFYLIYEDITGKTGICLTGTGCQTVQNSTYSSILGIKLSFLGVIASLSLLVLFILNHKKKISKIIFPIVACLGALFGLYFLFLQFFIIKAICSTCLAIDASTIVIALLSLYIYKK